MTVGNRALAFIVPVAFCVGCAATQRETASSASNAPAFGSAMADVGRRFELLGRALVGARFELAEYELGEIEEAFENTLPRAAPPREGHPEVLPALVGTFRVIHIPELRRRLATRDGAEAASAFQRMATGCNECHVDSGHAFIEVPLVPGRPVPNTDQLTP